jgi:plastocyanin
LATGWNRLAGLALAGLAATAAGCGREGPPDLVKGKQLFTSRRCASCHTLARANAKGTQGPSLDAAFAAARRSGMTAKTIEGIVREQIDHPRRGSIMPAKLVTGQNARDVAAYVGRAASVPGKDTGPLALVGPQTTGKPALEKNGVLEIDMDPSGALAYVTNKAGAMPGKVAFKSMNKSSVQHDIALKGPGGELGKGAVVGQGGTSQFTASVKPGTYTFFCSVPGHEQGGMKGTLTVK